jgi:hypothetical protein
MRVRIPPLPQLNNTKLMGSDNQLIPQAKMMRLIDMIMLLLNSKMTVEELATKLDTSKRTIARYIALLSFLEIPVDKDFDNRYFIVNNLCPFCGKDRTIHEEQNIHE